MVKIKPKEFIDNLAKIQLKEAYTYIKAGLRWSRDLIEASR
jgi:hypothetical protein